MKIKNESWETTDYSHRGLQPKDGESFWIVDVVGWLVYGGGGGDLTGCRKWKG